MAKYCTASFPSSGHTPSIVNDWMCEANDGLCSREPCLCLCGEIDGLVDVVSGDPEE
jgi:hypothetical protein